MKNSQTSSDSLEKLIRDCQNGVESAWEELVARFGLVVHNFAYSMTNNQADAEEAAQEIFVKLIKNIQKFEFKSSFKTWLHRVVVNGVIDFTKKKKRHTKVSLDEIDPNNVASIAHNDKPSGEIEREEIREKVWKILNELPEHYRAIMIMREMEERSYAEIAEILECPVGTVESRLYRARNMFLEKLKYYEGK